MASCGALPEFNITMNFLSAAFYGVNNPAFSEAIQRAVNNAHPNGIFTGDNQIAIGRNLGFLEDAKFMAARQRHALTDQTGARFQVMNGLTEIPGGRIDRIVARHVACASTTEARLNPIDGGTKS